MLQGVSGGSLMVYVILCDGCNKAVRPNQAYTFRQVTGWEEVNRRGGPGNLKKKQYTGKVLCVECGDPTPPDLFGATA